MKRHSDYRVTIYSVELTQFDGRARGDDVIGNLTVAKLRASQVTVGKLAYRYCAWGSKTPYSVSIIHATSFQYIYGGISATGELLLS